MQSLAKGCNLDWYSAPIMAPSVLPAQDDLGQGLDGERGGECAKDGMCN